MATVFVIHGFVGSGKTTLSNQIADCCGAVCISVDEWYITLFGSNGRQLGIDVDSEERTLRLISEHWPKITAAGADVVLDLGFWQREARDAVRAQAAALAAEVVLIEVQTPDVTATARCRLRNNQAEPTFIIDEERFRMLRTQFQPLESDEERITFRT